MDFLNYFINTYKGNHISHLMFLRDKKIYMYKNNVLFSYQQIFNYFVVLGDPIGNKEHFENALKDFHRYAEDNGCKVVFYQANSKTFSENKNFKTFKIGEEAVVDLNKFTLSGKKNAKLRYRKNKLEKQGYQFEVIKPPHNHLVLKELKQVSNEWLKGKKEKSFSVSFYNEEYINLSPVCTLRNTEGELIAFATLGNGYRSSNSTIIDLMRHRNNSPHGAMDMLITSILSWAKENGYRFCSLGMCPLSNVGENSVYEKIANNIYNRSSHYNFKGLKEFKQKFTNLWDEKYIVYPSNSFFPLLAINIYMLIKKDKTKNKDTHFRMKTIRNR